jgi:hypothetical protein
VHVQRNLYKIQIEPNITVPVVDERYVNKSSVSKFKITQHNSSIIEARNLNKKPVAIIQEA